MVAGIISIGINILKYVHMLHASYTFPTFKYHKKLKL